MWALGILLYQLATNNYPFDASSNKSLEKTIKENKPKDVPQAVPNILRNLIDMLLQKDPQYRPDAASILKFPEIRDYVHKLVNKLKTIDSQMAEKILTQLEQI